MSVYVDELRDYGDLARSRGLRHTVWAHLTADTREKLHAFAAKLGLKRSWFQDVRTTWHYDVTAGKRAHAVRLGAQEVTVLELGRIVHARRRP